MEELEAVLALNLSVSSQLNCPSSIHPRFNNYKNNAKLADSQEERRKRVIESSKARREELLNEIRKITLEENVNSHKKKSKKFGDHLMLSEWLLEVPADLEENYSVVLCCVGKRCLVVATRGNTTCYDKSGRVVAEFPSDLNGGNRESPQKSTVLDCIYDSTTKTYHVIDMISHDNQYLYECETEFRWYWMECKFREDMPLASQRSSKNPCVFVLAPRFKCTLHSFQEIFSKQPDFEVDGLLFYHMSYPYVFGFSPVTTWLKPYMIPEIFGVPVHDCFLTQIPSWYTGFSNHSEKVKKKADEREQRKNEREAKKAESNKQFET